MYDYLSAGGFMEGRASSAALASGGADGGGRFRERRAGRDDPQLELYGVAEAAADDLDPPHAEPARFRQVSLSPVGAAQESAGELVRHLRRVSVSCVPFYACPFPAGRSAASESGRRSTCRQPDSSSRMRAVSSSRSAPNLSLSACG